VCQCNMCVCVMCVLLFWWCCCYDDVLCTLFYTLVYLLHLPVQHITLHTKENTHYTHHIHTLHYTFAPFGCWFSPWFCSICCSRCVGSVGLYSSGSCAGWVAYHHNLHSRVLPLSIYTYDIIIIIILLLLALIIMCVCNVCVCVCVLLCVCVCVYYYYYYYLIQPYCYSVLLLCIVGIM